MTEIFMEVTYAIPCVICVHRDTMATSDIRRGFLEAMLQWNSTVSIVRKPQYTDQSNRQQNNDNVIMVKTSKQRDVVMAPPIRYAV